MIVFILIYFLVFTFCLILGDHFRIEQNKTVQCQLLEYFTGFLALLVVKRHTNHRNEAIDGSPITKTPCPFSACGKNQGSYLKLKIGMEHCEHNGCILKLEDENTININFNVFSTDERGKYINILK